MKKKILASSLAILLVMTMVPATSVYAAGSYNTFGEVDKEFTYEGITYVDVYGGATTGRTDTDDSINFIKDAITANGNLEKWSELAFQIYASDENYYWNHNGGAFSDVYGSTGVYIDLVNALQNKQDAEAQTRTNYESSGLVWANAPADAMYEAANLTARNIDRKLKADDFVSHNKIQYLDDLRQRECLYTVASTVDRYGTTPQYGYSTFGIVFYDFQIAPINDGGALNTAIDGYSDEEILGDGLANTLPGFSYSINQDTAKTQYNTSKNESLQDGKVNATMGESGTVSVSNSISNSESYSYGQEIGISVELGVSVSKLAELKITPSFSCSFNEAFSTTYSEDKSMSVETNNSTTTEMIIPPHTAAIQELTSQEARVSLDYDCPLAVTYKVAVFSFCGTCYDDNAAVRAFKTSGYDQRSFITVFGSDSDCSNATESLYNRAIKYKDTSGYEKGWTYTQCISNYKDNKQLSDTLNWGNILNQTVKSNGETLVDGGDGDEPANYLSSHLNMSVTGGTLSEIADTYQSSWRNPMPLYKMGGIIPTGKLLPGLNIQQYKMEEGDSFYTTVIGLSAYDTQGADYYGFNYANGTWILLDENMQENPTNVVRLDRNATSGKTLVTAKSEGIAYLKYVVNDNTYYTYDGFLSNDSNIDTAYVKIIVDAIEKVDTLTAEGEMEIEVSADPVNIDSIEGVEVMGVDTSGKHVEVPYEWEAIELPKEGILVEDNMISATKEGTFNIRAKYLEDDEYVYSNLLPVTAVAAPEEVIEEIIEPIEPAVEPEVQPEETTEPEAISEYEDDIITRAEIIDIIENLDDAIHPEEPLEPTEEATESEEAAQPEVTEESNAATETETVSAPETTAPQESRTDDNIPASSDAASADTTSTNTVSTPAEGTAAITKVEIPKYLTVAMESIFADVPATHKLAADIAWAKEVGIIGGDPAGNFRPEDAVTRAELYTMLYGLADYYGVVDEHISEKIYVSHWAKVPLSLMIKLDAVEKDKLTKAWLNEPCPREEAAECIQEVWAKLVISLEK